MIEMFFLFFLFFRNSYNFFWICTVNGVGSIYMSEPHIYINDRNSKKIIKVFKK